MRTVGFAIVAAAFVGVALRAGAQTPPPSPLAVDAQAVYVRAVRTMQALPQPTFITFDSNFVGVDTGVQVSRLANGSAQFAISTGGSSPDPIPTAYRAADRLAALTLKDGIARSNSPLYDPTWAGAAAFARYGLHPPVAPSPIPVPATPDSSGMPVIGGVSVFTVAFYKVADGGAAVCPNGAPGKRSTSSRFAIPTSIR